MLSKTCLQENKNDSTIQTYDLVVLQKLYPYASMCYIYKNGADFTSTRCSETRPPPPPHCHPSKHWSCLPHPPQGPPPDNTSRGGAGGTLRGKAALSGVGWPQRRHSGGTCPWPGGGLGGCWPRALGGKGQ